MQLADLTSFWNHEYLRADIHFWFSVDAGSQVVENDWVLPRSQRPAHLASLIIGQVSKRRRDHHHDELGIVTAAGAICSQVTIFISMNQLESSVFSSSGGQLT
jgi:hypothetical protein